VKQGQAVFAMHQIGSKESNQLQETVLDFGYLLKRVHDQISDESNRDLDLDCIA
jgi:hypothetical protein